VDVVDLLGDGRAFLDMLELQPCRAYSVMIGRWCGSQLAMVLPARTVSPSATDSSAPYGTLWRSALQRPLSSVMIHLAGAGDHHLVAFGIGQVAPWSP